VLQEQAKMLFFILHLAKWQINLAYSEKEGFFVKN
jgi:hypothetical protein